MISVGEKHYDLCRGGVVISVGEESCDLCMVGE